MSATLGMRERFTSDTLRIQSQSYECRHGKHYEVVVVNRACGHQRVWAHSHSYREHWAQMYAASEHLILADHDEGER